jgi:hypothetical protein
MEGSWKNAIAAPETNEKKPEGMQRYTEQVETERRE